MGRGQLDCLAPAGLSSIHPLTYILVVLNLFKIAALYCIALIIAPFILLFCPFDNLLISDRL